MFNRWMFVVLSGSLLLVHASCKGVDCGPGTLEKNGTCAPADTTVGNAQCGPFTELQGNKCVPMFPPTVCDGATTMSDTDPTTGVTTCIGTGMAAGCTGAFACPAPAAGKMTICGQVYDYVDDSPFKAGSATGSKCATATATGPCALKITPYDAAAFAANPATATPLTNVPYIDDCGRFRLTDIGMPSGGLVGIGIDDAAGPGPSGVTQPVGVGVIYNPGGAQKDFEGYVVAKSATDMWDSTGGASSPKMSTGIYAVTFRTGKTGTAGQAGAQVTKLGAIIAPPTTTYFAAGTSKTTLDEALMMTTNNGSALVSGASLADSLTWSGQFNFGADASNCQYENHGGISLPGIVYIQNYRPTNKIGQTCPR
jgi:hypothetical protein